MINALLSHIDKDDFEAERSHSQLVQSEFIDGQLYEARVRPDGSEIVLTDFGAGKAAIYSSFPSFKAFLRDVRKAAQPADGDGWWQ